MNRPAGSPVVLGDGIRAYLRLLGHGPAARPFLAAFVARLPLSMAPLSILLLVQHARGAYGVAGLVTGAFALGSAAGTPLWGRLMDRFGQIRVLVPTSLASATLLVALSLATVWGAPNVALVALSTLAGAGYPPISPAMRAAWRVIFSDQGARRVAFALDSTSVELIFVGGPLLVSLLLTWAVPTLPLLVTAGLLATGALSYCRTEAARVSRPHPSSVPGPPGRGESRARERGSAVTATGVAALLWVMLMLSIGFGQLDTSLAATAGQLLGGNQHVGVLFAAIAGGSTLGGLVFGARAWPFDERLAVPALLTVFAVLLGMMAILLTFPGPRLWLVYALLVVTGATIAPTLIMQQSLLDHLAPGHRLNEAQALLSAANTTGAAAGTALAGVLIDYHGLGWSFAGAALAAGVAAGVAIASLSHWRAASDAVGQEPEPRSRR